MLFYWRAFAGAFTRRAQLRLRVPKLSQQRCCIVWIAPEVALIEIGRVLQICCLAGIAESGRAGLELEQARAVLAEQATNRVLDRLMAQLPTKLCLPIQPAEVRQRPAARGEPQYATSLSCQGSPNECVTPEGPGPIS